MRVEKKKSYDFEQPSVVNLRKSALPFRKSIISSICHISLPDEGILHKIKSKQKRQMN